MKKRDIERTKRMLILVLAIVFWGVCIFVSEYNTRKISFHTYNTPEEAIMIALKSQKFDYSVNGKWCIVSCKTRVISTDVQMLYKTSVGWVVLNESDLLNPYYFNDENNRDGFYIKIIEYEDDYLVYVLEKKYGREENDEMNVDDSLKSEIAILNTEIGYPRCFHFWILDEIPEDYCIGIDGKDFFVNE